MIQLSYPQFNMDGKVITREEFARGNINAIDQFLQLESMLKAVDTLNTNSNKGAS